MKKKPKEEPEYYEHRVTKHRLTPERLKTMLAIGARLGMPRTAEELGIVPGKFRKRRTA